MPTQLPLFPNPAIPALPWNAANTTQLSFFPAPPNLPPPPSNFINTLPTNPYPNAQSQFLSRLPAPPPAPPSNFINALPAAAKPSGLRMFSAVGPQINPGSFASKLPGPLNKALTGGGAKATMGRRLAGSIAIQSLGELAQRAQGDTAPDPTTPLEAFTRGATGGGSVGAAAGPIGAAVGALGAGIGNLAGYAAMGGEGHLGNIPVIGGLFGGGSASSGAPAGPDLSPEGLKAKLNSFNFTPEVREQVKNDFNQLASDLRAQGVPLEQATQIAYNQFFVPQTDESGAITGNAGALQYRDAAKQQSDAAKSRQTRTQQNAAQAVAFQALLSDLVPQIMGDNPSPRDRAFFASLPALYSLNTTKLAEAQAAEQAAKIQELQLKQQIENQSTGTNLEELLKGAE